MSYAVEQSAVVAERPRRPGTVTLAAVLLAAMGVVGLAYAVVALFVIPGVVDRFRAASGAANSVDVGGYVVLVWVVTAVATALAVIVCPLFIALALGLRRGSQASRIAVWVLAGLGALTGCITAMTVLGEVGEDGVAGSLGTTLTDSYPG